MDGLWADICQLIWITYYNYVQYEKTDAVQCIPGYLVPYFLHEPYEKVLVSLVGNEIVSAKGRVASI